MARNLMNRYVWLVDTIYRAHKISLKDINQRWLNQDMSEGQPISQRTFHKWRNAIEEIFGIAILCEVGGAYRYYIEDTEEIKKGGLRSWLMNTMSVSNLLLDNQSLKDRILLEEIPSGKSYLSPIIQAMKRERVIKIVYYNYRRGDLRDHELMPLCVKLFRQRWYMVCKSCRSGHTSVYSLDRIQDFTVTDQTFEYPDDFDAHVFFEDSFGIIAGTDNPAVHVVLKTNSAQANYLRDLPIHHSQHETDRQSDHSIFEMTVQPTFDFIQELLWMGDNIEVLEPASLRDTMKKTIQSMLEKYE